MTDAWAPHPPARGDDRAPAARAGCALALAGLFVLGFVAVAAVLLLRAPEQPSSRLGGLIREPAGYVRLDDADAGGGPLSETRAAVLLGQDDVPGFRDGLLRAFGRRPGEPVRAVVVLAVEVGSPEQASTLHRAYATTALRRGATAFATPAALRAQAFQDRDAAGRYAQRVVFTRGARLFVVSLVTPDRDADTAEVVALATAQAAAL